jgi:NADPH-dependent 2,4-dienoyl-CoA reductase/sulfur reductase-like enzyme
VAIVGFGTAGAQAAIQARRYDRDAEIDVFNAEDRVLYSRCALPALISGELDDPVQLQPYPLGFYQDTLRLNLHLGTRVVGVDPTAKTLTYTSDNGERILPYDELVLATGGYASRPIIPGAHLQGVHVLRTLEDAILLRALALRKIRVSVLGAGFVGMELADAFRKRGCDVQVIHRSPEVMSALLDPDMGSIVREAAEKSGVGFHLNSTMGGIKGRDRVEEIEVGGTVITTDAVVSSIGVLPDLALAQRLGLVVGETGGIRVDEKMRTNLAHVYSAGDGTEALHAVTNQPALFQLATVSFRQGEVAGSSAVGGTDVMYPMCGASTTRLFGIEIASTGLVLRDAMRLGIRAVSGRYRGTVKSEYYPEPGELTVKLLFDASDGRLIGAQAIGTDAAAGAINLLTLCIRRRFTVHDLMNLETCYSPSVASIVNPVSVASRLALRRIKT